MADFRKSITFQAKLELDPNAFAENLKKQFEAASSALNTSKMQGQTAARASQMGFGGMTVPKPEDIQKSRRELSVFIREQQNDQEKLYKLIVGQNAAIEKIKNAKKESLKDAKEELKVHEQMLANLNNQYRQKDRIIQKGLNVFAGGQGGGGGGNNRNLLSGADWSGVMPPDNAQKGVSFLKNVGSIGAIMAAVAKAVDTLAGFPMRLEQAQGSAVQSFVGRDVSAIQSGGAAFETSWMRERAQAAEMAKSKRFWNRVTDTTLGAVGAAGVIGGTAMTGLSGGTLGIPGMAMIGGGAALLANDRYRSAINPFGQDSYNKLLNEQQGKDQLSTWEALKKQDPYKGAAIDRLQSRYGTDLATQRMTGLSDQGFYGDKMLGGGFQEGANRAGFNQDMAAAMAAQIQGGGGSTRGMRGLSTLGLQAQRGFDLTNAGGVLGRISGGAGGDKASEQIFRKLMEESIKAGLDKSDFREEQRRFADVTSEILSRSGVQTAEEAEKTLQGFTKYLGTNPTIRDIEGAKSAYQEQQSFSAETSGRGGALQYVGMLKDPILRKLGSRGAAAAMEIPLEDINPSNPFIIAHAVAAGVSPEELAKSLKAEKTGAAFNAIGLDQTKVGEMDKAMSKSGITDMPRTEDAAKQLQQSDPEAYKTYLEVLDAGPMRNAYGGVQKQNAAFLGMRRGTPGESGTGTSVFGPANGGVDESLGRQTRAGDVANTAVGQLAQSMLENFRAYKEEITPNTEALRALTTAIMTILSPNRGDGSGQTNDAWRYLRSMPNLGQTKTQTQGGKSGK